MKTPLLVSNDSRDESREKDSWGTNILLESEAPTAAVKRPGLTLTYDGTTPGQGVFIWPEYGGSTVVTIEDDELTFPVVVEIGDFIDGYYAMVENPPTPPGPGDDYWSASAPDSRRYQAWSGLEVSAATNNDPAYWAFVGATSISSSNNCYCTTRLAASPAAAARQALRYLRKSCPGYTFNTTSVISGVTSENRSLWFYPYTYVFIAGIPASVNEASLSILNDTLCTDTNYIYNTSVVCATLRLTMAEADHYAAPPPATDPTCAEVSDVYIPGIHIVRRV